MMVPASRIRHGQVPGGSAGSRSCPPIVHRFPGNLKESRAEPRRSDNATNPGGWASCGGWCLWGGSPACGPDLVNRSASSGPAVIEGAENLCHLGRRSAERGPASSAGRAGSWHPQVSSSQHHPPRCNGSRCHPGSAMLSVLNRWGSGLRLPARWAKPAVGEEDEVAAVAPRA
jgi:hypothetical protein